MRKNNDILVKNINRMDDISKAFPYLDNELTVAQKLLGSIKKKMRKNKLIMCGTLAFLLVIVMLIIYSHVKGNNSTTIINQNPTPTKVN